jgi:uncharacterized protein
MARGTSLVPAATDRHAGVLARMMPAASRPALVPDAHLAALAIEHGLVLASADGDFAGFEGLHWTNPFAATVGAD